MLWRRKSGTDIENEKQPCRPLLGQVNSGSALEEQVVCNGEGERVGNAGRDGGAGDIAEARTQIAAARYAEGIAAGKKLLPCATRPAMV